MIDAHHHLWKYNPRDYPWMNEEMDALRRDFLMEDLRLLMQENGVNGLVTVQARQTLEETEWLLELAGKNDCMRGVVGWVPLIDPAVPSVLERFAENEKLKGVRHILHDEPDDSYMLRADFNEGISHLARFGLTYDILIFERHLPQTLEFVDRHPNQIFVVDHIAKPRIRERRLSPWRELMDELAARPNVNCKVSGMATEADWRGWTDEDLAPYFDVVFAAFGPQRLMFGSDWPVLMLASNYAQWVTTFRRAIAPLSEDEQSWVCHRTATEIYKLP